MATDDVKRIRATTTSNTMKEIPIGKDSPKLDIVLYVLSECFNNIKLIVSCGPEIFILKVASTSSYRCANCW